MLDVSVVTHNRGIHPLRYRSRTESSHTLLGYPVHKAVLLPCNRPKPSDSHNNTSPGCTCNVIHTWSSVRRSIIRLLSLAILQTVLMFSPACRASSRRLMFRSVRMSRSRQTIMFYLSLYWVYDRLHTVELVGHLQQEQYTKVLEHRCQQGAYIPKESTNMTVQADIASTSPNFAFFMKYDQVLVRHAVLAKTLYQ